jgi:hypothetical protein
MATVRPIAPGPLRRPGITPQAVYASAAQHAAQRPRTQFQLGATPKAPPTIQGTGSDALVWMANTYQKLEKEGQILAAMVRASGKMVPCAVVTAYHRSVAEYKRGAQQILDQFERHNVKVEQVKYKNGQPVPDPDRPGKYKTLHISAPLSPPTFTDDSVRAACGGKVQQPLGAAPVLIAAGGILGPLLLRVVTVAGVWLALSQISKISMVWNGLDPEAEAITDAYTACVKALVDKQVPPDVAAATCNRSRTTSKAGIVVLASLVVVGAAGGIWYYLRRRKANRGHLEEAGDETPEVEYLPPKKTEGILEGWAI